MDPSDAQLIGFVWTLLLQRELQSVTTGSNQAKPPAHISDVEEIQHVVSIHTCMASIWTRPLLKNSCSDPRLLSRPGFYTDIYSIYTHATKCGVQSRSVVHAWCLQVMYSGIPVELPMGLPVLAVVTVVVPEVGEVADCAPTVRIQ